jgi:hypothetical protein
MFRVPSRNKRESDQAGWGSVALLAQVGRTSRSWRKVAAKGSSSLVIGSVAWNGEPRFLSS